MAHRITRSIVSNGDGGLALVVFDLKRGPLPKSSAVEIAEAFPVKTLLRQRDAPAFRMGAEAFLDFSSDPARSDAQADPFTGLGIVVDASAFSDPRVSSGFSRMADQGRCVGIHSFAIQREAIPLLAKSKFVFLDHARLGNDASARVFNKLSENGSVCIASGIEEHSKVSELKGLGLSRFEGRFIWKPAPAASDCIPVGAILRVLAMAMLECDALDIEEEVGRHPVVAYRLLALLNSSALRQARTVASVRDAVMMLGTSQLIQWLSILLLSSSKSSGREAVAVNVACRAKICEKLAFRKHGREFSDRAFLAGLFSGMGPLLGSEPKKSMEKAGIGDEVAAAVMNMEGPVGESLAGAMEFESETRPGCVLDGFSMSDTDHARMLASSAAWAMRAS